MILKLQTNPEGWELISNIKSFRYSTINQERLEELQNKGLNRFEKAFNHVGNYVHIQAWLNTNQIPLNIVTALTAYMLNDEGKTIERIN